ncbi:unnamed protein product [Spirodela intermedia]|uniref:Uncharacterized protein n=1 Tax=Spirodela intermedia TaxID=51605 RepID=A0A7I8IQD0_SPIIN|nr:unnamed protein product [Spirodela intermedia]CAA6659785.1 unnamed protein product [Spirodela intermedia]
MPLLPAPLFTKQRCLTLLAAAASAERLRLLHALFETSGILEGDKFLASELIRAFALFPSSDGADHARLLLNRLPGPSTAAWNHVIRGYARGCCVLRRRDSVGAQRANHSFVLNAAAGLADLELGRQLHAGALKGGVGAVVYVGNALIHLYARCSQLAEARQIFDEMPARTVVSWNSMLSAYTERSCLDESLQLFVWMRRARFEPDETTFVVLLSAAAETSNLGLGKWVHGRLIETAVAMNVQLGTALVDMYAKSGAIRSARRVFERMSERNVWTWSTMILGLAQHGLASEALELFDTMKRTPVEPNCVTFLGVLAACSHGGLVDDGYRFFREMTREHGIPARMAHYSAMVDVLGRNGRLEEAYAFVESMPIEPDAVVWRTLVSACSIHSAADCGGVGSRARRRLLELEPERIGNHVIVANMYAEAGLWEAAAETRKVMRDGGMKKMPGESCIAVGTSVARFVSGDDAPQGHDQLCSLLASLSLNTRTETRSATDCVDLFLIG